MGMLLYRVAIRVFSPLVLASKSSAEVLSSGSSSSRSVQEDIPRRRVMLNKHANILFFMIIAI